MYSRAANVGSVKAASTIYIPRQKVDGLELSCSKITPSHVVTRRHAVFIPRDSVAGHFRWGRIDRWPCLGLKARNVGYMGFVSGGVTRVLQVLIWLESEHEIIISPLNVSCFPSCNSDLGAYFTNANSHFFSETL